MQQKGNWSQEQGATGLALAVAHLNAALGPVLTAVQLAQAMRAGTVRHLSDNPVGAALVESLFVELSPELIVRCANDAGANLVQVERLYQESLEHAMPPAHAWEKARAHLL